MCYCLIRNLPHFRPVLLDSIVWENLMYPDLDSQRHRRNDALALLLARKGQYADVLAVAKRGISETAVDHLVSNYASQGSLEKAMSLATFRHSMELSSKEVDLLVDAYIGNGTPNYACSLLEYGASSTKVDELVDLYVSYGWLMEANIAAGYRSSGPLTTDELDRIVTVSVQVNDTLYDARYAARSGASDKAIRTLMRAHIARGEYRAAKEISLVRSTAHRATDR